MKITWDYIAGIFDGEGTVLINDGRVRFQIVNTFIPVLEEIKKFLKCGQISVYHKNPEKWKPQGVYIISNRHDVLPILEQLSTRTIIKEKKILECIKFIKEKNWRRDIDIDIIKLKKLRSEGKSLRYIAKEMNISRSTVLNRLK